MKQLFMLLVFLFTSLSSFSQNAKFWYDASGNRTSRKKLIEFKSEAGFNSDNKKPVETFNDTIGETTILIFPNPVESQISIEIQGLEEDNGDMISLIDQTGRTVLKLQEVTNINTLDISDVKPGIYFMVIKLKSGTTKWNIIKK
jgi:Secretion system C-terminal sorting domain